jgi:hypothetical protein
MYNYLQHKSNEKLEALFDRNLYNESELVELKIAVNVPYQNTRATFERCDGEIKINGTIYKYVKRKLVNDTLYLMCLSNSQKMHLETAKNNFYKLTNDFQQNDQSNKSDHSKSTNNNLQPVFNESSFDVKLYAPIIFHENMRLPAKSENLLSASGFTPEQPPDLKII